MTRILGNLEEPINNDVCLFNIHVTGWALSTDKIKYIEVSINDKIKYFLESGTVIRPDVARAFPDIKDAEVSGFNSFVTPDFSNDVQKIKVNAVLYNGDSLKLGKRTITILNDALHQIKDKNNFNKIIVIKLMKKVNNELFFKLFYSNDLFKYFNDDNFFVKYDKNVEHVSDGILYIPVVTNIIQVCWAVGADLYLDELDKTFFESLQLIKENMNFLYPCFSFNGNIYIGKLTENQFFNNGSGQLFSGGVDSLATYIKHRNEKPALFCLKVYGSDHPIQKLILNKINQFVLKEGLSIYLMESNIMGLINEKELVKDYRQCLPSDSWWESVQHGAGTVALSAPLTAVCNIGRVYIASAGLKNGADNFNDPWGSHPQIDNNLAWADVKVILDGLELSRQEKINFAIYEYIKETGYYPKLTVCNDPNREVSLNCSNCEKCYRTIIGLTARSIDPNKCGFSVNYDTFNGIKHKLINHKLEFNIATLNIWKDIRDNIPENNNLDIYGSKQFFEWFKNFTFDK